MHPYAKVVARYVGPAVTSFVAKAGGPAMARDKVLEELDAWLEDRPAVKEELLAWSEDRPVLMAWLRGNTS